MVNLDACRAVAEQAMIDTVHITGPNSRRTNPDTGDIETIPGPTRYGPAK